MTPNELKRMPIITQVLIGCATAAREMKEALGEKARLSFSVNEGVWVDLSCAYKHQTASGDELLNQKRICWEALAYSYSASEMVISEAQEMVREINKWLEKHPS